MKSKILYTIFTMAFISAACLSQDIEYTYDAAGNRTRRAPAPLRLMSNQLQNNDAQDVAVAHGISVAPNPTKSDVVISIAKLPSESHATITVYDEAGKVLQSIKQQNTEQTISLKSQPAGVYFIKVAIAKEEIFYRIVRSE